MTTPKKAETMTERPVPVVHEKCVWPNKGGTRFAQWDAVAPEGATFEDLLEPSAWKRVQGNKRPPLAQDDEIRITAFDKSWTVWAIIDHASGEGVKLSKFADTKRSSPIEHLFEDDLYAVRFAGDGYGVFRKRDNHRMKPDSHPNPAVAERALSELYPRKVA